MPRGIIFYDDHYHKVDMGAFTAVAIIRLRTGSIVRRSANFKPDEDDVRVALGVFEQSSTFDPTFYLDGSVWSIVHQDVNFFMGELNPEDNRIFIGIKNKHFAVVGRYDTMIAGPWKASKILDLLHDSAFLECNDYGTVDKRNDNAGDDDADADDEDDG